MTGGSKEFIADRYELIEQAGEGGMATVYRGVQHGAAGFVRQVAIKRIKPEYQAIQNYINMFVEEARVGSDLAHPNIVQVHDFVIDGKSYYLVMEWVEGLDLGSLVRGFLHAGCNAPWYLVTAVCIDALRGLSAAHERRREDGSRSPVVHRDVSPHNILISINGMAKLTDFGLARARDRLFSLTAPGTVKGKLTYLSPEVSYGQQASPFSDIFSMGNVMWESLAGRRLFRGASDLDTFTLIRDCRVPSLLELRPDVPLPLAEAIHKALEREPVDRFSSAREMAKALSAVMAHDGWTEDSRLQLGYAVMQARAKQLSPNWREHAREVKPVWYTGRLDRKRSSMDEVRQSAMKDAVQFSGSDQPGTTGPRKPEARKTDSIDVEFSEQQKLPEQE